MTPKTTTSIAPPDGAPPAARAALTALGKIHTQRKALEKQARDLKPDEVTQVVAALNAGATWDHIAAAVGQAQPNAHRAYAGLLERPPLRAKATKATKRGKG